jgi:ADP-heptose:LPS heptosyltransferase
MRPPAKILVLSLSRMGDIVQSIPFFRRLRLKYPGAEIHVLAEECFADVAAFLPGVDRIHTVKLEDLLPNLAAGRAENLQTATGFYTGMVADLRHEHYDQVWNLTHTKPSTILNFLIGGENALGVTLDRHGLQRVNSPWLLYFFATNLARPWCQFNLVDIYANCIDGIDWNDGRSTEMSKEVYRSALPEGWTCPPGRTRIAIHTGASQATKQWPVRNYHQVAKQLAARGNVEIVLIGGKKDTALSEEFAGVPNVVNFMGRTNPLQLAAVLSRCDLTISNDSGPMHIAAAVGSKVLDITVGTALASETAPYGAGHVVVEPESDCFPCSPHHACANVECAVAIRPEVVTELAELQLGWRERPSASKVHGCRVYKTELSTEDGMLELRRIYATADCARDELNQTARPMWLSVLTDRPNCSSKPFACPVEVRSLAAEALVVAYAAREQACELINASKARAPHMPTIERLGQSLAFSETCLENILNSHGLLRSFLAYHTISRSSLTGDTLEAQARETVALYDTLERLLSGLAPETNQDSKTINSPLLERGALCASR